MNDRSIPLVLLVLVATALGCKPCPDVWPAGGAYQVVASEDPALVDAEVLLVEDADGSGILTIEWMEGGATHRARYRSWAPGAR